LKTPVFNLQRQFSHFIGQSLEVGVVISQPGALDPGGYAQDPQVANGLAKTVHMMIEAGKVFQYVLKSLGVPPGLTLEPFHPVDYITKSFYGGPQLFSGHQPGNRGRYLRNISGALIKILQFFSNGKKFAFRGLSQ
jgi:hypothetical protein